MAKIRVWRIDKITNEQDVTKMAEQLSPEEAREKEKKKAYYNEKKRQAQAQYNKLEPQVKRLETAISKLRGCLTSFSLKNDKLMLIMAARTNQDNFNGDQNQKIFINGGTESYSTGLQSKQEFNRSIADLEYVLTQKKTQLNKASQSILDAKRHLWYL